MGERKLCRGLRWRQAFANVGDVTVSPVLALVGLAVIGLLALQLQRPRWRPGPGLATLLAAGAPLILLGLALGPGVDFLAPSALRHLAPVTVLAVGWLGASLGARFEWRHLRRVPVGTWATGLLGAGAALVAVALGLGLLARLVPGVGAAWAPRLPAFLALAAVAAASGPGAVALAARMVGLGRPLMRRFRRTATFETAAGALALSVPLALVRPHAAATPPALGWLIWIAGAAGAAGLASLAFLVLTDRRGAAADTNLALVATLLFAAGLGYATGRSPFLVCALAAAVIVNFGPSHRVRHLLAEGERPLAAVMLVVVGASLGLPGWIALAAVPLLATLRIGAKWVAVRYVGTALRLVPVVSHEGLATVAQGAAAVALGLSFALALGPTASEPGGVVLATVALGAGVADLAAPALLRLALGARRAALTSVPALAELSPDATAERPA